MQSKFISPPQNNDDIKKARGVTLFEGFGLQIALIPRQEGAQIVIDGDVVISGRVLAGSLNSANLNVDGDVTFGSGYAVVRIAAAGGVIDAEGGFATSDIKGVTGTFTDAKGNEIEVTRGIITRISRKEKEDIGS